MADKKAPETVDEYISSFPENVQEILQKIRKTMQDAAPETKEGISYGIPTYYLDGKYLVYFAGWKDHVSVYPIPGGDPAFQKEIAPYISGRGTLKFSLGQPIPYDLIRKVVLLHLAENQK